MSFARPTLDTLKTRILADFESRLDLAGKPLRRSVVRVMAYVFAGVAHGLYGFLEYLGDQLFPDVSADAYLIRQASVYGITKNPPTYAAGTVTVYGTDGTVIPAGTVLVRSDGVTYETDEEIEALDEGITVDVTATAAGDEGTLVVGMELSFESPIANVVSTATVDVVTLEGEDEESTESLRSRLLERLREAPHGGTEADYVAWAKEVTGVTHAWAYGNLYGAGTVRVYFLRYDDEEPQPSPAEVDEVQAYIDTKRPVTADVVVSGPDAVGIDMTIEITPDTSTIRDALEAEVSDMIRREAEPGGTILLSALRTAIGNTPGLTDYVLTVPSADVTQAGPSYIAILGTVTYV